MYLMIKRQWFIKMDIQVLGTHIDGTGDVISVDLVPETMDKLDNEFTFSKQLIICLDISGSMDEHIETVKNLIKNLVNEISDDDIRKILDLSIITFNNVAVEVWNTFSKVNLESILEDITCEGLSNFSDALDTCFKRVSRNKHTWILMFSDGECNKGKIRTIESFKKIQIPERTKIICYGFDECDEELLHLYNFTYEPSIEHMKDVAEEIITTKIFDINVSFISDNDCFDDLILGESVSEGELLCGDYSYFNLPSIITYLPYGNIKDYSLLNRYNVKISYTMNRKTIIQTIPIKIVDNIPNITLYDSRNIYYNFYKLIKQKRRDEDIFKILGNFKNNVIFDPIKNVIENLIEIDFISKKDVYRALSFSKHIMKISEN